MVDRVSIRAGKGLGDSLYLQSIARHLVEQGQELEICSEWPDVFRPLAAKVVVKPFRRNPIDRVAHYVARKAIAGTDQFQDMCIHAGLDRGIDLRLDWVPDKSLLTDGIVKLARGRPIVLVQLPREPFARLDGFGRELLPDCRVIQRAIDQLKNSVFIIQVGAGKPSYQFESLDLDLTDRTTISGLINLAYAAQGFLGYCSFIIPLAESLGKPELLIWSRRGLNSRTPFIHAITPKKILHRSSSNAIVDDCSDRELTEAVDAFCQQIGDRRAVCG